MDTPTTIGYINEQAARLYIVYIYICIVCTYYAYLYIDTKIHIETNMLYRVYMYLYLTVSIQTCHRLFLVSLLMSSMSIKALFPNDGVSAASSPDYMPSPNRMTGCSILCGWKLEYLPAAVP